ncbi:hypothetical protein LBMAG53_17010 [Planctomycetota bacterium]|nr:hypothetical protein LBMAG53_17010 [Planctomycetota bacterium]
MAALAKRECRGKVTLTAWLLHKGDVVGEALPRGFGHSDVRFTQLFYPHLAPYDAEVDQLTIGAIQATAMTPDSTMISDPVSDPGPDGSKIREH